MTTTTTETPKRRGRWKPGESGNPKGRPPGAGEIGKLRAGIAVHLPGIIAQLIEAAKGGDVQAAKLLLERVLPPVKPTELATTIPLPDGTLTDQGRAVLAAVGLGDLAPGQGAQLLSAIGTLARVVEVDELTDRVTRLEAQHERS